MLELAIIHEESLQKAFAKIALDPDYMFLTSASYRDKYEATKSTWSCHEFASVHDGQVIGYITYSVDREVGYAHGLQIANFSTNKSKLGCDVKQAIDDIFMMYGFHKLKFSVIIGNPIEKTYDRLVRKMSGKIVGEFENDVKLLDGSLRNIKHYEIYRDGYLHAMQRKSEQEGRQ